MFCNAVLKMPSASKNEDIGLDSVYDMILTTLITFCITNLSEGKRVKFCSEPSKVPAGSCFENIKCGFSEICFEILGNMQEKLNPYPPIDARLASALKYYFDKLEPRIQIAILVEHNRPNILPFITNITNILYF